MKIVGYVSGFLLGVSIGLVNVLPPTVRSFMMVLTASVLFAVIMIAMTDDNFGKPKNYIYF